MGIGVNPLGREIDLPVALLDVRPAALEMGQSANVKKAVKINACAESLLILDAPFRRVIIIYLINMRDNYGKSYYVRLDAYEL